MADDLQIYFNAVETECLKRYSKVTKYIIFPSGERMTIETDRVE